MTTKPDKPIDRLSPSPGFTMVELMVSILIVAILMLGVNAVFTMSAKTVGGGMSVLNGMRDHRAVANTLASDFRGMLNADEMPFFIIYSQTTAGFRDERDAKSDTAYTPGGAFTTVIGQVLQDPTVGYTTPVYVFNNRNHRTDILQFFTHGEGLFRRQTGGQNVANSAATYQSAYTSDTACVWIGHGRIANNLQTATFNAATTSIRQAKLPGIMPDPGNNGANSNALIAGGNPTDNNNTFYANQWVLCRRAILLGTPDANGKIFDANNVSQQYLQIAPNAAKPLSPLAYGSTCTDNYSQIQDSICDLAGRSVSSLRGDVQVQCSYYGDYFPDWYAPLLWTRPAGNKPVAQNIFRFVAKPWVDKTKGTGGGLNTFQNEAALTTPILLQGCSQFIVEYAGDYLTQDTVTGQPLKETSDGTIDFNFDTANKTRSIRWYGLSRSMNGGVPVSTDLLNGAGDVRPLYTYLPQSGPAFFEKVAGTPPIPTLPFGKPANMASYTCAWSADELTAPVTRDPQVPVGAATKVRWPNGTLPWLIRVTIRLDDANGRLPDGQTLEYIFRMPGH